MRDINRIKNFVKKKMSGESTGHDWFHVERVLKSATTIAKKEKMEDLFIIKAASLLHDLGDWKVNTSNMTEEEIILSACKALQISKDDTKKILEIILNMSFSQNVGSKNTLSLEGKIVQDADRLDALGAIGIARAFAYGGKKDRELYNPTEKPKKFQSTSEYKNGGSHTINHFYEKLFLLRSLMNTTTGKKIALKRERFMNKFLKEFYLEWDGKK